MARSQKTGKNNRETYIYYSDDGAKITITPGKDGVTETDIQLLHALDDAEFNNNRRHEEKQRCLMKFVPHKYQTYAEHFILEHPACGLFLDLGLGKTVITLNAINSLLYDYFDVSKVLVIAPLRVAQSTWSQECEKWEHLHHLRISKILGSVKERRLALSRKADIYIINRENVEWLTKTHKCDFDMVVIDELACQGLSLPIRKS